MNRNIRFTIIGNPIAKRRHRNKIIQKKGEKPPAAGFVGDYIGNAKVVGNHKLTMIKRTQSLITIQDFTAISHSDPRGIPEEAYLKMCASLVRPRQLYDEAMFIYLVFYFPIPKSFSKKFRSEIEKGVKTPAKTPDADNQEKAIWDAFNGVIWRDDCLVDRNSTERWYSSNPRTEILLGPFHDAPPILTTVRDCLFEWITPNYTGGPGRRTE